MKKYFAVLIFSAFSQVLNSQNKNAFWIIKNLYEHENDERYVNKLSATFGTVQTVVFNNANYNLKSLTKATNEINDQIKKEEKDFEGVLNQILATLRSNNVDTIKLKQLKINLDTLSNMIGVSGKNLKGIAVNNIKLKNPESITRTINEFKFELGQQANSMVRTFSIPSESELIDALAIFIANRMKEEAALTFFDYIKTLATNDSLIIRLLPKTYQLIVSNSSFDIPHLGTSWQYAFANDIINMPINLKKNNSCENIYLDFYAKIIPFMYDLYKGNDFKTLVNHHYYLSVPTKLDVSMTLPYEQSFLIWLKLINDEFFDEQNGDYWVHYKDFCEILNHDEYFVKYFTLLYNNEKYNTLLNSIWLTSTNLPLEASLEKLKTITVKADSAAYTQKIVSELKQKFYSTALALDQISTAIDKNSTKDNEDKTSNTSEIYDAYHNLFKNVRTYFHASSYEYQNSIITNVNESLKAINYKNYQIAISACMEIIKKVYKNDCQFNNLMVAKDFKHNKKERKIKKKLKKVHEVDFKKLSSKDQEEYTKFKIKFKKDFGIDFDMKDFGDLDFSFFKNFLRADSMTRVSFKFPTFENNALNRYMIKLNKLYLKKLNRLNFDLQYRLSFDLYFKKLNNFFSFISDLLKAKNSKDVVNIVDAYGAPVSSYKIKRNSRFSVDINSYPGVFIGLEKPYQTATINNPLLKPVGGFSCPVGLSYSFGTNKKSKAAKNKEITYRSLRGKVKELTGQSLTVTGTIIDIGAVVAYRLTNDSTKGLPKDVTFEQFFSPGAYFQWGIKKTPLCLFIGIQVNPKIRELQKAEELNSMVRGSMGIAFDIPIFHVVHTRTNERLHKD